MPAQPNERPSAQSRDPVSGQSPQDRALQRDAVSEGEPNRQLPGPEEEGGPRLLRDDSDSDGLGSN